MFGKIVLVLLVAAATLMLEHVGPVALKAVSKPALAANSAASTPATTGTTGVPPITPAQAQRLAAGGFFGKESVSPSIVTSVYTITVEKDRFDHVHKVTFTEPDGKKSILDPETGEMGEFLWGTLTDADGVRTLLLPEDFYGDEGDNWHGQSPKSPRVRRHVKRSPSSPNPFAKFFRNVAKARKTLAESREKSRR